MCILSYNLLICYLGLLFRKFIKNEKSVLNVSKGEANFDKNSLISTNEK